MGEQKPEKTKKHICAGLLAHVRAGMGPTSPPLTATPAVPARTTAGR